MGFRSTLHVAHIDAKRWKLTRPLVFEGQWQFLVIRAGFHTDFASIPMPVRWLLDNAGRNAEAAVLHDAVWRESKRPDHPRVDPWHADGMFRSALRETGSPALTRSLMWFAVRLVATLSGRFGRKGPSLVTKLLQLAGVFLVGLVSAAGPTIVAAVGLVIYWVASWIVASLWWPVEQRRLKVATNWPWPVRSAKVETKPPDDELLLIINKHASPDDSALTDVAQRVEALLTAGRDLTNEDFDGLVSSPIEALTGKTAR